MSPLSALTLNPSRRRRGTLKSCSPSPKGRRGWGMRAVRPLANLTCSPEAIEFPLIPVDAPQWRKQQAHPQQTIRKVIAPWLQPEPCGITIKLKLISISSPGLCLVSVTESVTI